MPLTVEAARGPIVECHMTLTYCVSDVVPLRHPSPSCAEGNLRYHFVIDYK